MKPKGYLSIFIDADDTLWRDSVYYESASRLLYREMGFKKRYSYDHFIKILNDVEMVRCKRLKHYAEKEYVCSAKILCKKLEAPLSKKTERLLLKCLSRRWDPSVYPGVRRALKELLRYGDLFLFTKGRKSDYMRKLQRTGLTGFFSDVVSDIKTPASFRKMLRRHRLRPSEVIVIGDSYANDIEPALANKLRAIYVRNPEAWSPENSKPISAEVDVVDRFAQVPSLLAHNYE